MNYSREIYDAASQKIGRIDASDFISAVQNSLSGAHQSIQIVEQDFSAVALEMRRPSILLRLEAYPDGNAWCALHGRNLQEGVAGFGDTPDKAMRDFDKNWIGQTLPLTKEAGK